MKDQIANLGIQIAQLIIPVIALFIVALIGKGITALSAKTKNETILHLLQQMESAADTAVKAAQQLVLDKLPLAPGSVPAEKLEEAKTQAMSAMKAQLGPTQLGQIKSSLGLHSERDLDTLLSQKIEAKVHEKNLAETAALTVTPGGTP